MSNAAQEKTYTDLTIHNVSTMASELERLAVRLRMVSHHFADPNQSAVSVAAEKVNDYVQRVGSIGGRLNDVVRNAGQIDKLER